MEFTSFAGNKGTVEFDVACQTGFNEIPLISSQSPTEELLGQLKGACTRVHFLDIKDHGVPQETIDALFATAERLFAQDSDAGNVINYKMYKIFRGYEPPAKLCTDQTRNPGLNEAFNQGYEKSLDPFWADTTGQPGICSH
ncbi:hypothetical protein E8E11_009123 [Didymella keratinophila]|nr:hypothetical protein E8E11_009123 [Didymella keratinophila]